jgi:hypothetical protein
MQIAGYATKGNAKRKLQVKNIPLIENEDYITEDGEQFLSDRINRRFLGALARFHLVSGK